MGNSVEGLAEKTEAGFGHVERRIDDVEVVLAKALSALAKAESKEERIAALSLVDELPTMAIHREHSR